jgi:hypothetical protein
MGCEKVETASAGFAMGNDVDQGCSQLNLATKTTKK